MNGSPHTYARLSAPEQEALEAMLAAFALGALADDEARGVAQHLGQCPECGTRAAALLALVRRLPDACDEVAPSPDLKGRLLAAAAAEPARLAAHKWVRPIDVLPPPATGQVDTPDGAREAPVWRPPSERRRRGSSWRWALPTAALLLVSLGLGAWDWQLQQSVDQQRQQLALYEGARQTWRLAGSGPAAGASGVVVEPASGPPQLVTRDLPTLPRSQAYQAWIIRDGQPASAGVFPAGAGGQLQAALDGSLDGASTVAITVEPAGGSPGPTGPIVLAANL